MASSSAEGHLSSQPLSRPPPPCHAHAGGGAGPGPEVTWRDLRPLPQDTAGASAAAPAHTARPSATDPGPPGQLDSESGGRAKKKMVLVPAEALALGGHCAVVGTPAPAPHSGPTFGPRSSHLEIDSDGKQPGK